MKRIIEAVARRPRPGAVLQSVYLGAFAALILPALASPASRADGVILVIAFYYLLAAPLVFWRALRRLLQKDWVFLMAALLFSVLAACSYELYIQGEASYILMENKHIPISLLKPLALALRRASGP
jgi:hypothetical protein